MSKEIKTTPGRLSSEEAKILVLDLIMDNRNGRSFNLDKELPLTIDGLVIGYVKGAKAYIDESVAPKDLIDKILENSGCSMKLNLHNDN